MKRWLCSILTLVMLLGIVLSFPMPTRADEMSTSDECIAVLKTIEGFAKKPYWDNTQWTVGWGTRCPDDKLAEYKKNGITEEEAQILLDNMLADFEADINKFAAKYELTLSQNQFDAILCFSYNCGTNWMNDSTGYVNRAVREGWTGSQFIYAWCLWSSSGGDYILQPRRLSECYMYLEGVYEAYNSKDDGTYPDTYKYVYLDGNGGNVRYVMNGYDAADTPGVTCEFTAIPTGTDKNGNTFSYTHVGWATSDGTIVEKLDGSLADGTVLYAQWADPKGNIVALPKGTVLDPVTVTVSSTVNIRSGPGTFYAKVGSAAAGSQVVITETYSFKNTLWGKCDTGWLSLSYTDFDEIHDWPRTGKVNADGVNVRSGAGTSYDSMYKLNSGSAVTICDQVKGDDGLYWGLLEDGNWICMTYVTLDSISGDVSDEGETPIETTPPSKPTEPQGIPGDVNGDETVNKDDAIYLLRYVVYPDKYPISVSGDVNGDGETNKDDAIYLLRHVVYPDKYPLSS